MPQLSIETFVSQYFWFVAILLTFYILVTTQVLPRIAEIIKTRQKTSVNTVNNVEEGIINEQNGSHGMWGEIYKGMEININTSKKHTDAIKKASVAWVKKNV